MQTGDKQSSEITSADLFHLDPASVWENINTLRSCFE